MLDLAIVDLNTVLGERPNDEVARYNLGLAFLVKQDTKAARLQFTESAKLSLYYIAPRLALAEMDQKARSYSETIRISNDVLAVDPANADAKLWHAAGMIGNKDYNNARTELNGLLRQYPDSANV